MPVRRYRYQVIHNGAATLYVVGDVQTQQGLQSGQTYVCQFDVWNTDTLARGDTIYVRRVDADSGTFVPQFRGKINRVEASRYPHRVTVYCQGPLAKLRRARLHSDYEVTGLTDGQAVKYVLDYCGVTYDDADIADAGYVLGAHEKLYFKKGQTGADFIGQIDDVFNMATIDCLGGRVVRFPYSRVPDDYPSVYATYRATPSGEALYDSNRALGNLDEIHNAVVVTGASWDCGDNDECSCVPTSESDADNPLFESGIRTAAASFGSDFIQDSSLADIVATRLMREGNREPDTMSITVANDPLVFPGRPVAIQDDIYGIGIGSDRKALVTDIQRVSDLMTLSLVLGAAGATGTPTSYLDKQCNDTNSSDTPPNDGSDVLPVDIPPVTAPVECSDIHPPDTTDPFIGCTELSGLAGTGTTETAYLSLSGLTDGNWRGEPSSTGYIMGGLHGEGGATELIFFGGGGITAFLNDTHPYASKTMDNDFTLGPGPVFTFSCEIKINSDSRSVQFIFGRGNIEIISFPGQAITPVAHDPFAATAILATENETAYLAGTAAEHTCTHPSVNKNNGGYRPGGGFPTGVWTAISGTYDFASAQMRTYYNGPDGGYIEDTLECSPFPGYPIAPTPCTHPTHYFEILAETSIGSTFTDPTVEIRGLTFGHTTCVANPDYNAVPSTTEDDPVPCSDVIESE